MQRAEGRARASFRIRAGRTRLEHLFQDGCAKVRLPSLRAGHAPEAILINTAGGLAGGDRLATRIDVSEGASAIVTTQACERVYRSTGVAARVSNHLDIAAGGSLFWLPQETILFDGGRLERSLEADIQSDGRLVAVEAILFGRSAMGETVRNGALRDRWRIRRDGRLVFADDLRVEGAVAEQMCNAATLNGMLAMATVLYTGAEPERWLERARTIVGDHGGASAWGDKFLARLVAGTGLALRRRLEPLLSLLLSGQPLPKVWQL
jgi:urease accessory protein